MDLLDLFAESSGSNDQTELAKGHFMHELQPSDRDVLHRAKGRLIAHLEYGSMIGMYTGWLLASRLRSARRATFRAFRAREKPTRVVFADGGSEAIPDITPLLKPTILGAVATYLLSFLGGFFLGGGTGLVTGLYFAKRTITRDPEAKARIETAYRKFRADGLRKRADCLDSGESVRDNLF